MKNLACYTTPEAAGRTASSSLPVNIPSASRPPNTSVQRTLEKLLQKRALRPLVHLEENAHHMVRLLPTIEGLLEVLAALVYEDLDGAWIGDVSICLEFLADAVADVGRGFGDGVQGDDFGGLRVVRRGILHGERTHGADPASVEINDTAASLLRAARHARGLRQTGRYRRHCSFATLSGGLDTRR
jgi:hypothetical protein